MSRSILALLLLSPPLPFLLHFQGFQDPLRLTPQEVRASLRVEYLTARPDRSKGCRFLLAAQDHSPGKIPFPTPSPPGFAEVFWGRDEDGTPIIICPTLTRATLTLPKDPKVNYSEFKAYSSQDCQFLK